MIEGVFDMSYRVRPAESSGNNMFFMLREYLDKPVAVLCSRLNYFGVLTDVKEDCLVLSRTRVLGLDSSIKNDLSDIAGSVIIALNTVEIVYQPRWVE
jgi:hypothetical protein